MTHAHTYRRTDHAMVTSVAVGPNHFHWCRLIMQKTKNVTSQTLLSAQTIFSIHHWSWDCYRVTNWPVSPRKLVGPQCSETQRRLFCQNHVLQCAAKKKYPKSCLPFSKQPLGIVTWNFTRLLLVHKHIKTPSGFWLLSITAKLQNFMCDHLVIFTHSKICVRKRLH